MPIPCPHTRGLERGFLGQWPCADWSSRSQEHPQTLSSLPDPRLEWPVWLVPLCGHFQAAPSAPGIPETLGPEPTHLVPSPSLCHTSLHCGNCKDTTCKKKRKTNSLKQQMFISHTPGKSIVKMQATPSAGSSAGCAHGHFFVIVSSHGGEGATNFPSLLEGAPVPFLRVPPS